MNLTLIGMPASGKSRVGAALAAQLGYELIDPDKLIEAAEGRALQEVLDELGDAAFMEREADVVIDASMGRTDLIIAPGGSIVYTDRAMQHLKENSKIVYLWLPLEEIEQRIKRSAPRGIVHGRDRSIEELYAERTPLYERWADAVVKEFHDTEERVREILSALKA